jgi:hypothetical protein
VWSDDGPVQILERGNFQRCAAQHVRVPVLVRGSAGLQVGWVYVQPIGPTERAVKLRQGPIVPPESPTVQFRLGVKMPRHDVVPIEHVVVDGFDEVGMVSNIDIHPDRPRSSPSLCKFTSEKHVPQAESRSVAEGLWRKPASPSIACVLRHGAGRLLYLKVSESIDPGPHIPTTTRTTSA